jgi:hypothetical protein
MSSKNIAAPTALIKIVNDHLFSTVGGGKAWPPNGSSSLQSPDTAVFGQVTYGEVHNHDCAYVRVHYEGVIYLLYVSKKTRKVLGRIQAYLTETGWGRIRRDGPPLKFTNQEALDWFAALEPLQDT